MISHSKALRPAPKALLRLHWLSPRELQNFRFAPV